MRLVPPQDPRRSIPKPLGVADDLSAGATARGDVEVIGLGVADARHHLHILGPTGTGKSTLLLRLILADAMAGRGVAVIDPHGDLALKVLTRLPASCRDRLILIDPDESAAPASWNVLDPTGLGGELVTEHLVGTLHRLYAAAWGPRLEDTLRAACLTLTHPVNRQVWGPHGAPTLADIPTVLTNPRFRARLVRSVTRVDPGGLGAFWAAYEALTPAQASVAGGPVLSKLRAVTSRRFAMDLLGVAPSTIDLAEVLDGGILIARLPKGILGEDTTRLVGSLLLTGLWQAATARTRQEETDRLDAAIYADECHNFLHLPIGLDDALAEARSYRLSWTLAHQHLGQLPKPMADALDANARNKIYFTLSPQDAHQLARHTAPHLIPEDLTQLEAFQIACRVMANGHYARAFTLRTLPAPPADPHALAAARDAARARGLSAQAREDHAVRRRRLLLGTDPTTHLRHDLHDRYDGWDTRGDQATPDDWDQPEDWAEPDESDEQDGVVDRSGLDPDGARDGDGRDREHGGLVSASPHQVSEDGESDAHQGAHRPAHWPTVDPATHWARPVRTNPQVNDPTDPDAASPTDWWSL